MTIPPSYLDIGMSGNFEGFGVCNIALLSSPSHIMKEVWFSYRENYFSPNFFVTVNNRS